jgi:hypothetical protein
VQLLRKPCDLDELRLAIRRAFAGAVGAAYDVGSPARSVERKGARADPVT